MKIYAATAIGESLGSNPASYPYPLWLRILYYMKQNQWRVSDVQLRSKFSNELEELPLAIRELLRKRAIVRLGD